MDHKLKYFVIKPVIYTFQEQTLDIRNFNTLVLKQKSKFGYKALQLKSIFW